MPATVLHVLLAFRAATGVKFAEPLRIKAVHAGEVSVILYRADEGVLRPCGMVQVPHDGFAQGAVNEVHVVGTLQGARACEPSDRVRLVVTQLGQEFLATGRPGLPDATLRYFLSP